MAYAILAERSQLHCAAKPLRRHMFWYRSKNLWHRDGNWLCLRPNRIVAAQVVLQIRMPHRAVGRKRFPLWIAKNLLVEPVSTAGQIYRAFNRCGRDRRLSAAAVDGSDGDFQQRFEYPRCR